MYNVNSQLQLSDVIRKYNFLYSVVFDRKDCDAERDLLEIAEVLVYSDVNATDIQ